MFRKLKSVVVFLKIKVSDLYGTGCSRDIKPALNLAENGETIYIAGQSMSESLISQSFNTILCFSLYVIIN